MIVRMNAKNQRACWVDDQRRMRRKEEHHYTIGDHLGLLIERVDALEAQLAALTKEPAQ